MIRGDGLRQNGGARAGVLGAALSGNKSLPADGDFSMTWFRYFDTLAAALAAGCLIGLVAGTLLAGL
jgi:hypothetical protein